MKKPLLGPQYFLLDEIVTKLKDSVEEMEGVKGYKELTKDAQEILKETYEDMYFYLLQDDDDNSYRICSDCGDVMNEGYCIEAGKAYYCSDTCLEKHMSKEEYETLYDDGEGDSYWTQWNG